MRTTITLDDDVHGFVTYYAHARRITLSAALNELIRKAEAPAGAAPGIVYAPNGFPMFPPVEGVITSGMVKDLEAEEFDHKKLA